MNVITDDQFVIQAAAGLEREDLFPIREVSRLTGVNPVTLRAWERRYGLIQPTRTESGHRLYSMGDIEKVRSILAWIERGVAVSKISKILSKTESLQPVSALIPPGLVRVDYAQWQRQVAVAVANFDDVELDRIYGQIFSSYAVPIVFQRILMPLWQQLLQRQQEFGQTSEWLFFDGFLRSRVSQRLLLKREDRSRRVLVSAIAGQCRELELLVTALYVSKAEVGIRLMTVGQPFDELTLVCQKTQPLALVLVSNHAPVAELPKRLNRLAMSLDCPLMLAGDASDLMQECLAGSSIGCLGNDGTVIGQRLRQLLAGNLDT
ncbi:MerR family transcriptional regulator [Pseudomonas mediterranea]|uniref:MerR HTH family regulatory protein n=1 Tax=Pseudomonas mediterranea TaxID=183795 RepID=A0AAX2DK41_9PSED|nr:MerR family transcriptional regulator [Pseudomonas mediterranea]KGU86776.1 MerR family transcriptional regulator [Pseudomonas mediterranea CFBP 5447]MDU9028291.1 MerR family transcriptional regulator [Pseudomonas mediterranea]QHA80973.1 MerR family transcriptional regulator [Pseudomonas mediterranea]UZE01872.1 MerR family transcriptional regulator [Pseudomonas mediterranea]SDU75899.1 MerR HTH family regulatory protein [Pseudomonas mediterranea]